MGYASKLGRARVSASNPQAAAICDRCGFVFNHVDLKFQYDYAGAGLYNKRILVCDRCDDIPQHQLKAIVLPADPVPVINPRPQDYDLASHDYRVTTGQDTVDPVTGLTIPGSDNRITEDKDFRVIQANGDGLLRPKVIKKTRITTDMRKRITEDRNVRVTEELPINPLVPPRVFATRVRVTDTGDTRQTVEDGRRVTELMEEK
jgi:hypothetical protein